MESELSVAMIEPVGGHAGMDYYDSGLCEGLIEAGVRTSLFTCDETTDTQVVGLKLHLYYRRIYGLDPTWKRGLRYISGTIRSFIRVIVNRNKICHFHVFHGASRELILVVTAKLLFRRVVITVHDIVSFTESRMNPRWLVRLVYDMADRLIVHNEFCRDELLTQFALCSKKIVVIPHGAPALLTRAGMSTQEARRVIGLNHDSKVVLFAGQIKDIKGLDVLIGSMPTVIQSIPKVVFLIAGRPLNSDFTQYESMIDKLDVRPNCMLNIQYVPNEMLSTYYQAATVVVLPYRKIYQSGVLLTSMGHGKPTVVSDVPGMLAVVQDGTSGYVFHEGSSDDLAAVLIRALQNDEERQTIATRATEYLRQNHDWKQIGRLTAELYTLVLQMR